MSAIARPSSPTGASSATNTPAGRPVGSKPVHAGALRRRAAALNDGTEKPMSTRAAGAGGSSSTMMRLYTSDDSPGLKVDPVVVMGLAVVFIASVVGLHLLNKLTRVFMK
ncbi:Pre protein translocase Sec Sec61-beta subunit [Cystobasidium minutum MCA 4210]|uniref:Pre protein translocase Sec Sec61-beta subunit n=1 Tax=Cystobasidium minutum MCA 4210 TaxID=1397322 RepID=UPI0034CD95CC|eukprot:jgi/Rhomi1/90999/CE90998_2841